MRLLALALLALLPLTGCAEIASSVCRTMSNCTDNTDDTRWPPGTRPPPGTERRG